MNYCRYSRRVCSGQSTRQCFPRVRSRGLSKFDKKWTTKGISTDKCDQDSRTSGSSSCSRCLLDGSLPKLIVLGFRKKESVDNIYIYIICNIHILDIGSFQRKKEKKRKIFRWETTYKRCTVGTHSQIYILLVILPLSSSHFKQDKIKNWTP